MIDLNLECIAIVGCGTLGATMAYKLCLMSLEKESSIQKLTLIDNDYLEEKNFPYLTSFRTSELIGRKKAITLKNMIQNINPELYIGSLHLTFPDEVPHNNPIWESVIIDCRDTIQSDCRTLLKMNFDGKFGIIETFPINKDGNSDSRYRFGNSRLYADKLSTIAVRILLKYQLGMRKLTRGKYAYNLLDSLEHGYEIPCINSKSSREDTEL